VSFCAEGSDGLLLDENTLEEGVLLVELGVMLGE
jgi:hypothetical protein